MEGVTGSNPVWSTYKPEKGFFDTYLPVIHRSSGTISLSCQWSVFPVQYRVAPVAQWIELSRPKGEI